jgi:hypothetical protein
MRNSTERTKGLAVVRKPLLQHGDYDPLALIRALQNCSDRGQASISSRLRHVVCAHEFIPKTTWSPQPQIHILGQLSGTLFRSLRQATFGLRLQTPGDAPKQMLAIRRWRIFSKQSSVASLQLLGLQLAQVLDFLPQGFVHVYGLL